MSCFFGCFGAKDKLADFQPPFVASITTKEHENETSALAKVVSRHQLSDLFASQELEDISYHEKSAPIQSADTQNCNEKVLDSDKLPEHTWTPPAKARDSAQVLDSVEESPNSCISDPPSVKNEKGNLNDTSKESLVSQMVSPSCNKKSSDQNGPVSSHKNLASHESKSSGHKAGNKLYVQANRAASGRSGRSPRDRRVLRSVTAQWNEEVDPSRSPLKWWDGNGIPNSTNKYREDQIVSWDGTPFEERLEKALSEANSIAQRKDVSGTYDTFEQDETDTAASQIHALLHPKSVVSF